MKKHHKSLFLLAGLVVSLSGTAKGQSYGSYNGFSWFQYGNALEIDYYSYGSSSAPIVIPATINSLPVVAISSYAFDGCLMTSVTIPNNVTNIGISAFENCANLTDVTISSNVTSIGAAAFSSCSSLRAITVDSNNAYYSSVGGVLFDKPQATLLEYPGGLAGSYTIPAGVTSVGDYAFYGCANLTNATIPAGVGYIGELSFFSCTNLADAVLPDSVTNIGQEAFEGCSSLTSVAIPGGITDFEGEAFENCTSLRNATIAYGLTRIPEDTFGGDISLTNITIPESVRTIGDNAFTFCTGLTSMAIPGSVYSIGQETFYGCSGLTNITFTNGLQEIGEYAFNSCTGLTSVELPASLASIAPLVFTGCSSLTAINVDANNPDFSSLEGVLFDKAQATLLAYPGGLTGSYTVPAGVTYIEGYAFNDCNLSSVTFPKSVTGIGDWAFGGCYNLSSVYFAGAPPALGEYVFYGEFGAIYYYLSDSSTWTAFGSNNGYTVVLWNPLIQANGANFGVRNNHFGFNITGTNDFTVVVEACTNLASPVWVPLSTNTLTNGSCYFNDPQGTSYPTRFYGLGLP